jgi:hypothetical protein
MAMGQAPRGQGAAQQPQAESPSRRLPSGPEARHQPRRRDHLRQALGHRLTACELGLGDPRPLRRLLHPHQPPLEERPGGAVLYMQGIPCEDELLHPDSTWVFSYPIKSPEGAVTRHDMNAIEQLELWLVYADEWCEHKPSITVYVRDDEWMEVGAFVYKHFDKMSGVSFLPERAHLLPTRPHLPAGSLPGDRRGRVQPPASPRCPPRSITTWSLLRELRGHLAREGL